MPESLTADAFVTALRALASPEEAAKRRRHYAGVHVIGVRMGTVFELAKAYAAMPLDQIDALLDHPAYEARMGAVSVMDAQARRNATSPERREALFELYLRRHDRLDNWDFPDRAAPHVVGRWLAERPRDVLYRLARSADVWERRTALVATAYFLKQGEVEDTYAIAELLLDDPEDSTQKAVGSWLREAGKRDPSRLIAFLDEHAARMSRVALRSASERLEAETRSRLRESGSGV
jgi:3-methyladenine DNA glycosylase AlkD